MNVLFDGRLTSEAEVQIPFTDRGFQYGDGIFETIICRVGIITFLDLHWERLLRGMKVLSLSLPAWMELDFIRESIEKLIQLEKLETARVKILVWRKKGGLYAPSLDSAHVLIIALPNHQPGKILEKAAFSQRVRIAHSPTSAFKTLSSMPYILAGMEKSDRGLNELIILDQMGAPSECTAANLFWIKDNQLFTPPLQTGCIDGIRRRYIIDKLAQDNPVNLKTISTHQLLEIDQVFTTNVTGICWIRNLEERSYQVDQYDQLEIAFKLKD